MVSHLKNLTINEKMLFDEAEFKRLDVTLKYARIIMTIAVFALIIDAGYLLIEGLMSLIGDSFNAGALLPIISVGVVAVVVIVSAFMLLSWNSPRHARLLQVKNGIDRIMRHVEFYGADLAPNASLNYGSLENGLFRATKRSKDIWIIELFLDNEVESVFSAMMQRWRLDEITAAQDALPYSERTVSHLSAIMDLLRASKEVRQQAVNAMHARDIHMVGEMLNGDDDQKSAIDTLGEQFR